MEIRMTSEVSLQEAEDMILACGNENAIHLVGEPGVGKTAMFERVVDRTGFRGVYMDVPNLELGEVGIPMPNHETKTTSLYPNDAWGFHKSEPMVIFLDEFTKPSSQAVQNTLHPLLNERRIANFKLHPDSIVITAGNNSSDGVGDNLKAHSLNRITVMPVRKPTAEEWLDWGSQNGVAPEMLAWVKAYPHAMASYLDPSQADNPYIFNPKFPKRALEELGFKVAQWKAGLLVPEIGNTYAGSAMIGLSAVLDEAQPGQRILMVSYGSGAGSDAFDLLVTERMTAARNRAPSTRDYIKRRVQIDYAQYVRMRRKLASH
jgi:hypothetical protein